MGFLKKLPNLITSLNLLLGCWAISASFPENVSLMFILFLTALFADFMDGLVARMLHAQSEIGKQLDSLADLVTFGVFPSFLMYSIATKTFSTFGQGWLFQLVPFSIAIFTAWRLAKFNLGGQSSNFIGLPSPANATLIFGIYLFYHEDYWHLKPWITFPPVFFAIIGLSCWLLISQIPFFSLKFRNFLWKGNEIRFTFAISSIFLILSFQKLALAVIIILYISLSIIIFLSKKSDNI